MKHKKLFVISGMSGAGKSQALKCFEDFGFFCVDNLPLALLDQFAKLLENSDYLAQVALGIDIREGKFLKGLSPSLQRLKAKGFEYRLLFLDASDTILARRFSETRHKHPLGEKLQDAIRQERRELLEIKAIADKVIDTSSMTLGELKESLSATLELRRAQEMSLSLASFGYKYGLPMDADLVMDVRFLPNPNYSAPLKKKTGLDLPVQRYILHNPLTRDFLSKYKGLILSLLPHYIQEGKSYLTLTVGCTGGRHRSVFVTHYLAQALRKGGYAVSEVHRDIHKRP